jgi:putative peptide zinc metalloprotease protein
MAIEGAATPASAACSQQQTLGSPTVTTRSGPMAACLERPALMTGVELVGEAFGSGFRDRSWLVQRSGQYLQVSELLYRVLEQATGERTLAEIAEAVTDATEWLVGPEQVQWLLREKLLPLGLIASPSAADAERSPAVRAAPGALSVNLRARVIGPRWIDPLAGALQVLFVPPALMLVLAAIVVVREWLYLGHGLAAGMTALLNAPALALVVLGLGILSDVFHELGHAAALRYGGGRARGIGVGFYLIYPVFYTDVTDSYRLDRWDRVRTDLGGIYFHGIFSLAVMGLYALTRQEFLLVAILLIDLNVLRQLIPFVRLDGYWLLADLTGIRDLFSLMGPFVQSLQPGRAGESGTLPPLKRWVAAAFLGFIVLTVPVLTLLMLLMLTRLPNVVITIGRAMHTQQDAFAHALATGDGARILLAAFQLALLALQLAGIAYVLFRVGGRWLRFGWRWSRPTPARRFVGALGVLGLAALLTWQWTPQVTEAMGAPPMGVRHFTVPTHQSVTTPVVYTQSPPVGGDHSPAWQDCGFYTVPVANEHAVDSMDRGAVWITYRPDLPPAQIDLLRQLAQRQTYVLVSPYPGLPTPAVASAWGVQLPLSTASDPRLAQFVRAYRLGVQAPDHGAPCTGGVGA